MVSTVPIYIISAAFAGVFLLLAALISSAIKYSPYNDDPLKRRVWFWIFSVTATVGNLLFGLFIYYFPSQSNYAKAQYINAIGFSTGLCFILYVLLGFIISKVFKNGKLGNWF